MSRTNHPRVFGTHRALSVGKEHYERGVGQVADYGTPLRAIEGFRSTARARIDEGLAQMAAPIDTDERWTERECASEWEALHLFADEPDHYEPMAEWEIALLTPAGMDYPDDAQWTSSTWADSLHLDPDVVAYEDTQFEIVDEDDDYPESFWLAGTVDEVFPDGGYIVEGPAPRPSASASGYVRVYDLARELGITSRSLVTLLRNIGEYVASHSSHVAIPTADAIRPIAGHLVACYGERPITADDRLSALRNRLSA